VLMKTPRLMTFAPAQAQARRRRHGFLVDVDDQSLLDAFVLRRKPRPDRVIECIVDLDTMLRQELLGILGNFRHGTRRTNFRMRVHRKNSLQVVKGPELESIARDQRTVDYKCDL
jgi:hypothetical protein